MVQIKRILCAVDLLKPSQAALSHAVWFAGAFAGAQLDLVNVSLTSAGQGEVLSGARRVEKLMREHNGREKLDRLLEGATPDILARSTPYLLTGKVIPAVLGHARASDADLIVLGVGRSWAFTRLVLVGMAERIVHATPCPVLSVRETAAAPAGIGRILVPVDFSSCTDIALDWATALAERFGARLGLLHVSRKGGSGHAHDAQTRHSQLLELAQRARLRGVDVDELARTDGSTPARIVGLAASGKYDLIVMGRHPSRRYAPILGGGVGSAVRVRSPIPVLSVRGKESQLPMVADERVGQPSPRSSMGARSASAWHAA